MTRFVVGVIVYCLVVWTAKALFGVDASLAETITLTVATLTMLLVNEAT